MTDATRPTTIEQDLNAAREQFLRDNPSFDTEALSALRSSEFSRLDANGQVYLDYTGGGLYGESQVKAHMSMLMSGVYGNPHSSNPTSLASTNLDEDARRFVHKTFNASPDDYAVIFTANASGALKHIGESYPFGPGGNYLLTFDNHNSVNGIREFASRKGATVTYNPVSPPDLRLDEDALRHNLSTLVNPDANNLFAYPAQSNFSGVQHSLEWIEVARSYGWDVLVDCAAFAPTNQLDLSRWQPDFVSLSFYKIFGYPTGVGALIVRRDKLTKLQRPWFAGGTIELASVQAKRHFMAEGEAAFEDGTIDYLNLPAVEMGLRFIDAVGIDQIHERVSMLTGWLLDQMSALKHSNGKPLMRIYGPLNTHMRGGTIAFNCYDPDEKPFSFSLIEQTANEHNISLRTGCFCNPGAGELALQISSQEMDEYFNDTDRMSFSQFVQAMTQKDDKRVAGAVRVSIGLATNFEDVYHFIAFARHFLDRKA